MAPAASATQAGKTVTVPDVRMFSLGQRPGKIALFAGCDEQVRAAEEQLRDEIRSYGLAEIRKSRHLTQQQVAVQMGVTAARVSQIEHGQLDRAVIGGLAGYVEALGGHLELVVSIGDERIVIGLGLPRMRNPQPDCMCMRGGQVPGGEGLVRRRRGGRHGAADSGISRLYVWPWRAAQAVHRTRRRRP
jgi:predicted XRE-type DNA-binding protein